MEMQAEEKLSITKTFKSRCMLLKRSTFETSVPFHHVLLKLPPSPYVRLSGPTARTTKSGNSRRIWDVSSEVGSVGEISYKRRSMIVLSNFLAPDHQMALARAAHLGFTPRSGPSAGRHAGRAEAHASGRMNSEGGDGIRPAHTKP